MKTKSTLSVILAALSLSVTAQETTNIEVLRGQTNAKSKTAQDFEQDSGFELPKQLIVYKNPNVKGVRLDSIRSLEPYKYTTGYTTIYTYPEDGGKPSVSWEGKDGYCPFAAFAKNYNTEMVNINGARMTKINQTNTYNDGETITEEYLDKFLVKREIRQDGKLISMVSNKYDDVFNNILHISEEYDAEGNITAGTKDSLDINGDTETKYEFTYNIEKKAYEAVKKTETVYFLGWIKTQKTFTADEKGKLTDCVRSETRKFYFIECDSDKVDLEEYLEYEDDFEYPIYSSTEVIVNYDSNRVIMTTTDITKYDKSEDAYYNEYEYSYSPGSGITEYKAPIFINNNAGTKHYEIIKLRDGDSEPDNMPVYSIYDKDGYITENGQWTIYHNQLRPYSYESYKYAYKDGINVGCIENNRGSAVLIGAWATNECDRDLNYTNVEGSDAICPVIYELGYYDAWGAPWVNLYYYSSADGTIEPKQVTDITETTDISQEKAVIIYDINGKVIKTCGNGKITLPEAQGIYIINDGGKIYKVKK